MRLLKPIGILIVFGAGMLAGRFSLMPTHAVARADAPTNPYASMLHVGIVVKDLDKAVQRWNAIGFTDIRALPPNARVDRMYHGKPLNATLKQAFIHRTTPLIELMEPPADVASPWGDYLKEHGEALHHLACRIPDTRPELEKSKKLGIEEIAQGKWPEGKDH